MNKSRYVFYFGYFLILNALFACGGGGGGGSSNDPGTTPVFTITPTSIQETIGEGEAKEITVTATPNVEFEDVLYLYIIDTYGAIKPAIDIIEQQDGSYEVTITTSEALASGTHSHQLDIRACRDEACSSHYSGSPMSLPYEIEVVSATNLTPLAPWTSVNDWEMVQQNAEHTGYVPVTLNYENFSPRWRWANPEVGNEIRPVVSANEQVYVVSDTSKLYALTESDHTTVWEYDFGSVFRVNDPAISDGKIYLTTTGHDDTAMWSIAADDGTLLFETAFESQWPSYYAPTIYNGTVYSSGGYYGGINAFDTTDGDNIWFTNLSQYDMWTPAVDDNYVYTYVGGSLSIIDPATGEINASITDPYADWSGWSMNSAAVKGTRDNVLVVSEGNNALVSFDIPSLSINWAVAGDFTTQPALANGVIYIANESTLQLEARDEASGTLLWSWSPSSVDETAFYGNVVATDNLVFVSTNKQVHAIEISTGELVWSYWNAGTLSISSSGILYIVTNDAANSSNGVLVAINLQ